MTVKELREAIKHMADDAEVRETQASRELCQKAFLQVRIKPQINLPDLRRARRLNGKRVRSVVPLGECGTCGEERPRYRFVCSALCMHWLCGTCHDEALHG